MEDEVNKSIEIMKNSIVNILINNNPSIYIFGSVVLDDFKLGWSDIDILCLTKTAISKEQASILLNLRQELLKKYHNNLYFRSFEGWFLSIDEFIKERPCTVVYWGTREQMITDKFSFDLFPMIEVIEYGHLIYGEEVRNQFKYPTNNHILKAVKNHYHTIIKYALKTDKNLYSAGWFLDIARCIYTLRTGKIISKTKAGKWAWEHKLVPDVEIMEKVISIREEPMKYKDDNEIMEWLETLGDPIQRFADVL